ncbi:MAG: FHA domain-containing protein [Candidatus Omnitrophica bacterium]|nr:FHA domain-containing protein [Candidatus Omnitrophota bacterium]
MAKIVFEIQYSTKSKPFYCHLEQEEIRIGRGFDCDLLINDPWVSAHHLVMRQEMEGGWSITDTDSKNGTLLNGKIKVGTGQILNSGDYLMIGRTKIRVFAPEHPVVPPLSASVPNKFLVSLNHPVAVFILFVLVNVISVLQQYLTMYTNIRPMQLLAGNILPMVFMVIWAGFWTFIGWLIIRKVNFFAQLSVTFFAFFISVPISMVANYWAFSTGSSWGMWLGSTICVGGWAVYLLTENLALATNLSRKQRIGYTAALVLALSVSFGVLKKAKNEEFSGKPIFVQNLMPPYVKLWRLKTADQFLKDSLFIFEKKAGKN